MEKIIRIHEKVLDHLLKLRTTDPKLYFVPRKIDNKQRLTKGFWFLGNEDYLHLSFWNGEDWKEKIHSIGFVILNNKTSFIEFSAQDSSQTAGFLAKVARNLDGFKKVANKNKWLRDYSGTNYLATLDDFIQNVRPIIDAFIKSDKPTGIKLLDQNFFGRYIDRVKKRREQQIEFGKVNKLARICWNTEGWKFPSGSAGKSMAAEAYEANTGFGHEEWLFDKSRIVDGYHYAFLRPLFLKSDRYHGQIYNISLFTTNNLNKDYYVGQIQQAECITREESLRVYNIYKANGWITQMKEDVERKGANHRDFSYSKPEFFFNIRFRFSNVIRPTEPVEIAADDINVTTDHYKLLPQKAAVTFEMVADESEAESEGKKKNTARRNKVFNSECEYDPYHDQMQNAIFDILSDPKKSDYKKVCIEVNRVDIKALTKDNTWHYFELKTDNAKLSIRKALGQVLEYAYYPDKRRAEKLIIVADEEPDETVIAYLNHIRTKFDLPIAYRFFDLAENKLSDDY